MASRKGFKVSGLIFVFWCTTDESGMSKIVCEKLDEYLKKYASNTSYTVTHKKDFDYDPFVRVNVVFTTKISVNTVMTILSNMFFEDNRLSDITYGNEKEVIEVNILG